MGHGGAFRKRGVSIVSQGQAQPTTLHLQPLTFKNACALYNCQILYMSSIAKTHNIKVVELFKTNPTI